MASDGDGGGRRASWKRGGGGGGPLPGVPPAPRLASHGPNELIETGAKSPLAILGEQFTSALVIVLIAAAVISAFLGNLEDTIVIAVIIVLNAGLGFYQEFKAERAMAALKLLSAPIVLARRDGQVVQAPSAELVPGDIVLLEAGSIVPADLRLTESPNLKIQESSLTGESEPVSKAVEALSDPKLSLGDRRNMAFMGTSVVYGRGAGVVVETGMQTQLGRIAASLQDVGEEQTPLQRKLDQLGRGLALIALVLVAVIFAIGLVMGEEPELMLLAAISLAVAAVPEGLPAVVTIALSLGAQRMLRRNALIRKLPAVEALGAVTVICSDKTGTLTENRMTVEILDVAGDRLDLVEHLGRGGEVTDITRPDGQELLAVRPLIAILALSGSLCSDAILIRKQERLITTGDPTEGALVIAAAHLGMPKDSLERAFPRIAEVPFDSERMRMTTIHERARPGDWGSPISTLLTDTLALPRAEVVETGGTGGTLLAITKGAVDGLIDQCDRVAIAPGRIVALDPEIKARISATTDELSASGKRMLGVALRLVGRDEIQGDLARVEENLIFVGIFGMLDPPRAEVKEAVRTCLDAGIRPVMITGDHPLTARSIAEHLGISTEGGILTGRDLAEASAADLSKSAKDVSVYARVSPEQKLSIVNALKAQGEVVAVTGDGVNDAPALRTADIGVAMGITGTDVSKETSDIVLRDDNFATIVAAVREGRAIYDNIRKFVRYILTSNSAEILVMMIAPFLGMPLALLPVQILWINLMTDGLPALALAVEPPEEDAMSRPPRPPKESIFARGMTSHVLIVGAIMGVMCVGVGAYYYYQNDPAWQTMIFTTLTFAQMGNLFSVRSQRLPAVRAGFFQNRALVAAVALTILLQLTIVYNPFFQGLFSTVALSGYDLLLCVLLSVILFGVAEAAKLVRRRPPTP